MSNAQQVYQDNVGHTHAAAVEAVFAAGFEAGQAIAIPQDPVYKDIPEGSAVYTQAEIDEISKIHKDLQDKIDALTTQLADAEAHVTELVNKLDGLANPPAAS